MKQRKLPKQRSKLYQVLLAKRASGAAGKHADKRKKPIKQDYYE